MKNQGWRAGTIGSFGILAAWFVACAGEDTPPVSDELRGALATGFGGEYGQTGSNGGAAGAGGGGSQGPAPRPNNGGRGGSANVAGSAAGAAGSGGDDPPAPVGGAGAGNGGGNVCDAYQTVFLQKCTGSNCHEEGSINGVFAGDNPPAAADLVNQASSRGEPCGVLVDPDDTSNSLILLMVEGTQDPFACFPLSMPLGANDPLTPDELECVEDWLTQFAD
jgi:hypothetical protein